MRFPAFTTGQLNSWRSPILSLMVHALLIAVLSIFVAVSTSASIVLKIFAAIGATFSFFLLFEFLHRKLGGDARSLDRVERYAGADPTPIVLANIEGDVIWSNDAARKKYDTGENPHITSFFRNTFADPSALTSRLQITARRNGAVREEILTARGKTILTVTQFSKKHFLWRIESASSPERDGGSRVDTALPCLKVGAGGTILSMNEPVRRMLGGQVKTINLVFRTVPVRPSTYNRVNGADGPIDIFLHEVPLDDGCKEFYLLPVDTQILTSGCFSVPVFDELPVSLLKIEADGRVVGSNRGARELLGDEIKAGTRLSDLVEGLGRSVRDWLDDAVQGRGLNRSEVIRARKPEVDIFLKITLFRVPEGNSHVLVAVLNDATELKTLEAQFVQSQKMQAIGQLAGGIAHDFNNLLTAITGHCDLLLMRHDPGDVDFADLMQINENTNRAASLVGQLLAFSRKQTLQPEIFDIQDTLSDLTHLLGRLVGEKISLKLSYDPSMTSIKADRRQLEQVIMNLVVNARDAMPDGGEIRIETKREILSSPLFRDRVEVPAGEYLKVTVSDDGVGIAPDKLPKIFEPFFTTKRVGEGTGLGLSMAYGIIKQSGGFIFADSVVGEGTTFALLFPAHEQAAPNSLAKPADEQDLDPVACADGEGVVLLVEDEAPVRAFAARALRLKGYTVIEAESGEDALRTLEDPLLNIDLFLTDVVMPGLDGPTWVRRARDQRPDVRVVFVSGYAEDAFEDGSPEIQNSAFLPKPFSLSDLVATVQMNIQLSRDFAASRTLS